MTIRPATLQDTEELTELTSQLGYAVDIFEISTRIEKILGHSDQLLIVAVSEDQKLMGWLQAHTSDILASGFSVAILGLVIAEHYRRSGQLYFASSLPSEWRHLQY